MRHMGPRRDEALRLALEHPVADVVTTALIEIARGANDGALSRVSDCLEHPSPEVRRVAAEDIWAALFPESAPATLEELSRRFTDLLDGFTGDVSPDRIRIVPAEESAS